jgi:hypothetical protein
VTIMPTETSSLPKKRRRVAFEDNVKYHEYVFHLDIILIFLLSIPMLYYPPTNYLKAKILTGQDVRQVSLWDLLHGRI